jgi:hypothetical protein
MAKLAPTRTRRRTLVLLPALLLLALAIPSAASAQATRTWVSGVGDDVNPCSRTAPCKTFAGAISKTAIGGMINAMDDGGFGAVTITKSITIDGHGHMAGVLAAGTNGIIINPTGATAGTSPATVRVVLRNLDIEGNNQSNPLSAGLNGVRFLGGKSLKIISSDIYQFSQSGVENRSSTNNSTLTIEDTRIHENGGNGVTDAPGSALTHKVTIRNSSIDDNTCGVVASSFGMTNTFGTDCGTGAPSAGNATLSRVSVFHSGLSGNGTGMLSRGSNSVERTAANEITSNDTGLRAIDGGQIISSGNNVVSGNTVDGGPTSTVPLLKLLATRP